MHDLYHDLKEVVERIIRIDLAAGLSPLGPERDALLAQKEVARQEGKEIVRRIDALKGEK